MENESLDLREPGGQRWKHFLAAVRDKKPVSDVVRQLELKLPKSLRKAMTEFGENGVQFSDFLESRNDHQRLKELVRKCEGHDYAKLLADTCVVNPDKSDLDLAKQYANSVVDRIQARVQHEVLDNEWKGLDQLNRHLGEVRDAFENEIHRIASSLVNNRLPTVRKSDKQQKDKDAKALLGTSLLGRSKQ